MNDQTVWMCPLPAWICVGTETGVYKGNGGFIIRALKIREKCAKLAYQEHSFVDDGSAAHGTYVGVVVALLELAAGNVQLAVKCKTFFQIIRLFDKGLHDVWHALSCLMSKNLRYHRDFSPAKEFQAFLFHDDLEHFFRLGTFDLVLREKELANTVFPFLTDLNSFFFAGFFEKSV